MKYKHAGSEGWYYQIDDNGLKSQSWNEKNKPKMYVEMMAYVEAGNEIEPQYTTDELTQKEIDDLANDLESQKTQCIYLLNESEKSVSSDPPYPDDVQAWKDYRIELRIILNSENIETIPEKPFS